MPARLISPLTSFHTLAVASVLLASAAKVTLAEDDFASAVAPFLRKYCTDCHGNAQAEAKVNLEQLANDPAIADTFQTWRKAAEMLHNRRMPPEEEAQPSDEQRARLASLVRRAIEKTAKEHARDPGPIVIRRLTSAEYAYTIRDLTGLDLQLENDFVSDAVGGEGFTNIGSAQFMQDSTLERYLDAAKQVAEHAVIGAGPISFYGDPGKTGFELSAITRIQAIYRAHGFRTAAGEGGEAFGLGRYPRAFYVAWRFRHRDELGLPDATLAELAREEGLDARFAEYIWSIFARDVATFPLSDIIARWHRLPAPAGKPSEAVAREACNELYTLVHHWQTRFGQNADAKEEAPVLSEDSFDIDRSKLFEMNVNWPKGTKTAHIRLSVESANGDGRPQAFVIWRKPSIQWRIPDQQLKASQPLSKFLTDASVRRFRFGEHPADEPIGGNDFVTIGTEPFAFELPILEGATSAAFTVVAELDVEHGDDCIVRCLISQEEETDQGKQVSALLANPDGVAFDKWKAGVLDFARVLPQVSHREPAPSDRDPIPPPFDNSYNNPERNLYHYQIKYHRDDRFLVDNILDDSTRERLDQAWADLLGSFEYHTAYLRFIATKYKLDLSDPASGDLRSLPPQARTLVADLHRSHRKIQEAFRAAEPGHVDDIVRFAERAWRRPLTSEDQARLRGFYTHLINSTELDHGKAIRAVLARVLIGPEFLYRAERPLAKESVSDSPSAVPLSDWELASRLSYLIWSSLPDEELRRAAAAGELQDSEQLVKQTRRLLRDPKARRFASEFFGQWFGFYRFDRYRGIDPQRFPEFTDGLKQAMHNEAVSFFEHIVRDNRPAGEIVFADYTFLNEQLAAHYHLERDGLSADHKRVEGLTDQHRGGLFGLGAVLTATSAPLRTSPVKRGDWVLRRVLGTPVPPPPADAGSIPADDVLGDGQTVRQRLEAHRREAACRNCHERIDPLGFALESYDPLGRWRESYRDGQAIETSAKLSNGNEIDGPDGLRGYLREREGLFRRTLCRKLLGYALGRRESIHDVMLVERMLEDLQDDGRFGTLVERIVTSRQFRFRRTDAAD